MQKKAFLFEWNGVAASKRVAELRAEGWEVESESESGARGGKAVVGNPPDVIIFDLAQRPSHSYETAEALRWRKAFKHVPMVFVDGKREAVAKTVQKVPDAVFTTSSGLVEALGTFEKTPEIVSVLPS